jgi:hypothetical protein
MIGSMSIGQRFFDSKLGVIVAGSYQNTYRGSNSTLYKLQSVAVQTYAVLLPAKATASILNSKNV